MQTVFLTQLAEKHVDEQITTGNKLAPPGQCSVDVTLLLTFTSNWQQSPACSEFS